MSRRQMSIVVRPDYGLYPLDVMRHPCVHARRVRSRAQLSEARYTYELVQTAVRLDRLERPAGVALARVPDPASVRIAGAQHARYYAGGNGSREIVQQRTTNVVDDAQFRLE